ncbi:hypothetical protein G6F22_016107 [Rhizopus arrhizus]|nr:hypothetical protein G6F22_016107 [Rhizopus arrhizus]
MTLRVTVICALTALVASAYGTPEAALSVYIVFFLIRPDRVTNAVLAGAMLVLHRLPAAAGFRHGRAVGRPALPDIRQQAAPGGRHHRDGRRLRAGPDGPRSDWRGQHAHPAVRVAHGGDPGRPGHHRQRRGRAVAAPARLRQSGAPAAAGRETAARRRGRGAGIRPGLAGRQ